MSNPKKKASKVVAARFCSLPSKHIVVCKHEDGTTSVQGVTTAFIARSTANEHDRNALEINSAILTKQIGALAFTPPKS